MTNTNNETTGIVSSLPKNPQRGDGRIILLRQGIKARIHANKHEAFLELEDSCSRFPVNYKRLHKSNPSIKTGVNNDKLRTLFDNHIAIRELVALTSNHTVYHYECLECHEHAIGNVCKMREHLYHAHGITTPVPPDMTGDVYVVPA